MDAKHCQPLNCCVFCCAQFNIRDLRQVLTRPETPPLTPNISSTFGPLTVNSRCNLGRIEFWRRTAAMCFGNARAVGPIRETVIVRLCSNGTLRFLERPPGPFCNETLQRVFGPPQCSHDPEPSNTLCGLQRESPSTDTRPKPAYTSHFRKQYSATVFGIGMNISKEPMTEHSTNGWLRFRFDQIE